MATALPDTSAELPDAGTAPASLKPSHKRKSPPTVPTSLDLHPDQRQAIRYLEFMTSDQEEPLTLASFMREAIARQLTVANRSMVAFPPAMLEKLTKAGFMK